MLWKVSLILLHLIALTLVDAKRDRLTHIVIPYHYRQLPNLLTNIELWSKYPPYINKGSSKDTELTIVFYSSGGFLADAEKRDLELRINSSLALILDGVLLNSIQHIHAILNGDAIDSHIVGSRTMFDLLLYFYSYQLAGEDPLIFFYMEPDCLPIRGGWVEALQQECDTRSGRFWMQGSIFHGDSRVLFKRKDNDLPFFLHINGNAMYNIGPESYFREYYLIAVKTISWRSRLMDKWLLSSGRSLEDLETRLNKIKYKATKRCAFKSYDMAIAYSLFLRSNFLQTRAFFDKFLYTDVVQNRWRSQYCLDEVHVSFPNTFLLHGGQHNASVCQLNE